MDGVRPLGGKADLVVVRGKIPDPLFHLPVAPQDVIAGAVDGVIDKVAADLITTERVLGLRIAGIPPARADDLDKRGRSVAEPQHLAVSERDVGGRELVDP